MDSKKRRISVEEDKGPDQAKRKKTEETELGIEAGGGGGTNINVIEVGYFQTDKSSANYEPLVNVASIALEKSNIVSPDGRSKKTDAQQDEIETSDELGVSASSTVIVTQDGTKSKFDEETQHQEVDFQNHSKHFGSGTISSTVDSESVLSGILTTQHQKILEDGAVIVEYPVPEIVIIASESSTSAKPGGNIDTTHLEKNVITGAESELDEPRIGREPDRNDQLSLLGEVLSPNKDTHITESEQIYDKRSYSLDEEYINACDLIATKAELKISGKETTEQDKRSASDVSDNVVCDQEQSKLDSKSESAVTKTGSTVEPDLREIICDKDVSHNDIGLLLDDAKPDKLEGDRDEKLNDLVSSLPATETKTVEEQVSEEQNQETNSVSETEVQNTSADESIEDKPQNIEEETKPAYPYRYLYRLLRADENPRRYGIRAKDPSAKSLPEKHVRHGSKGKSSQYISTSATWSGILKLKSLCRKTSYPKIAKVDCEGLSGVEFIDLTTGENRSKYLISAKACEYAKRFDEVLVIGYIPASHCEIV